MNATLQLVPPPSAPSPEARLAALENEVVALRGTVGELGRAQSTDTLCAVVHSCDLDKVLAAMVLATSSASMGIEVKLFFTFWGASVLRAAEPAPGKRPLMERLFGWMLPKGPNDLALSRMKMAGLGTAMIKRRMNEKGIASLEEMFTLARELGVQIYACEMSLDLVGLRLDDLRDRDRIHVCGATSFLEQAMKGKVTLFF